jgi:hypothetical protein
MKPPPGTAFDVTAITETIVDSLRVRLPAIVAGEVAKQLRGQAPRLAELESMAQRALNAQRARGIRPNGDDTP